METDREIQERDLKRGYTDLEAYKHFERHPTQPWEMTWKEMEEKGLVRARMEYIKSVKHQVIWVVLIGSALLSSLIFGMQ